jgi:hypothetical protein
MQAPTLPAVTHPGTGRLAHFVCCRDLFEREPVALDDEKYVLFIASDRAAVFSSIEVARKWIDRGASYICAWGPSSGQVEEAFDYATFLPELGEPLPFTLMTTSHESEELDEALWFAFYNAAPPEDLKAELNSVVILVDSPKLEEHCKAWVLVNQE